MLTHHIWMKNDSKRR